MALTGSGALSLNEMHVEAGGTSGDECSINDTDIRGLIDKDAGATMAINEWYGASASFYDFPITNSLKLNYVSEGYLTMTPSSNPASNQIFTMSYWIKRTLVNGGSNTRTYFLYAPRNGGDGSNESHCSIDDQNNNRGNVRIYDSGGNRGNLVSTTKLRDPNSWVNIVFAVDLTQGTDTNRVKLYFNGVQSGWTGTYPAQNTTWGFNNTSQHTLGSYRAGDGSFGDYYVADFNMIDGQQLAPTSFGEFKNDIWVPKDTSGLTFGTNGVRLEFKQTGTSANSSGIGADTSGNDHHFAVTALDATDVMPDSPTNNWCVMNALDARASYGMPTLSEGNLKYSNAGISTSWGFRATSFELTSGKWWGECRVSGNTSAMVGIFNTGAGTGLSQFGTQNPMNNTGSFQMFMDGATTTKFRTASTDVATTFEDFNDNDVVGLALDVDNETCKWYVNGSFQSNIGTKDVSVSGTAKRYVMTAITADSTATTFIWNFGQDSTFAGAETAATNQDGNGLGNFHHAVPSGYLSICSANLPDLHAAVDPNKGASVQDYFQTKLYTGNGASSLDIDLDFDPEVVWLKNRSNSYSHILANKLVGNNKFMATNGNGVEEEDNTKFRDFLTTSFRVGSHNGANQNTNKFVSWNWRAGASTSANTDGTINTSATSATPMGSYSIGLYTGNASNNQTIGHGLGGTPDIVIIRPRNHADNWVMSWGVDNLITGYNASYMYLNTNGAAGGGSNGRFLANDADTVNLGTSWNNINTSGKLYFMQCYRSVDGVSKCGVYSGNSNADGPFVHTGFRPAWLLFKKLNSSDDWAIHDNMRADTDVATGNSNAIQKYLKPNESNSEQDDGDSVDFVSNGFKWRISSGMRNNSGDKYLYIAFAHQPFKYANAR
jgi:hypothetical protein